MDFPEGLTLGLVGYDPLPAIYDADDVVWIKFTDGGNEDPGSWVASIILSTCKGLGITEAFNEDLEMVSVEDFVLEYTGYRFLENNA